MLYRKKQQHKATSYSHRAGWQSLQHLSAVGSMLGFVQHADVKNKNKQNQHKTKQTNEQQTLQVLENAPAKKMVFGYTHMLRSGV